MKSIGCFLGDYDEMLHIGADKWFNTWSQVPEEKYWYVTMLYRYWQSARMLWDSPPDKSIFPSPVMDLFHRASDIMQSPPTSYTVEAGLEHLALVCDRMIAAKPASLYDEAEISSYETEKDKLDRLKRLQEAHAQDAIAGLCMLADRLFILPAEAPFGIGKVVLWHNERTVAIAQAVVAQQGRVVKQDAARLANEALRERINPFSPYDADKLPRYTKHNLLCNARRIGNGWSNGNIIDFIGVPNWVKSTIDDGQLEFSLKHLVGCAKKAETKALPALMYIKDVRLVGLKYNKHKDKVGWVFVDALYWLYFQREHKGFGAFVDAFDLAPIVFIKDDAGALVGAIAPYKGVEMGVEGEEAIVAAMAGAT